MTLILQIMSIITLCSPSFAVKLVLMRPPGMDSFFHGLRSKIVPAEATEDNPLPDDPIQMMTEEARIHLCEDFSNAKLFLTEEDYTSLSNFEYPFPHTMDVGHKPTYKLYKLFVGGRQVPVHLLSCSSEPGVYLSYGFTDHYYFAFTANKSNGNEEIRLLGIVEPIPEDTTPGWSSKSVSYDFWRNTMNLDVETWMEVIIHFQTMDLDLQFRLCGLTYEVWSNGRESEGPTKYKISLPKNLITNPYVPVDYENIDYVTPALHCVIIDDSRDQVTEYSVVPNPYDEHSVLLAQMDDNTDQDDDSQLEKLKLTDSLTKVSCLYENDKRFYEGGYFDIFRNIIRNFWPNW